MRRRWVVLQAGILLLLLVGVYWSVGRLVDAPVFRIDTIVVKGNERLSTGEVLAALDGLIGSSLLRADLDLWRRRLVTTPWVREAGLRRILPSTLEVVVSEREPIGLARLDDTVYLVDRLGVIIDVYGPPYAAYDLPLIDGLTTGPGQTGTIVDESRIQLAARLIDAVGSGTALGQLISQIDVSDARNAIVVLEGDDALLYLGEERFRERLQSYLDLAVALRQRVPIIEYVDLRFDERVYVRPPAGRAERVLDRSSISQEQVGLEPSMESRSRRGT